MLLACSRAQALVDAAVARSGYVAGGKMKQTGVLALADELHHLNGGVHIGGERIPQVGIEIGQT